MAKGGIAKIFRNGRSQAVRLPREFRFDGDEVRVRKVKGGVLLEPIVRDVQEWCARMDRAGAREPLLAKGRRQPRTPRRKIFE